MSNSTAVIVLGMHRSGTSAIARGLQALGVYLGDNFLEDKPDNPTGYWEDRTICELNERVLAVLGLRWEDVSMIDDSKWNEPEIEVLRLYASAYLQANFLQQPLWGFKDPRSVRLLPFWQPLFRSLAVDDRYLIVIRNPRSVSASLFERQQMDQMTARMLWLVYMVPYLSMVKNHPRAVVDYDLVMANPQGELARVARSLNIQLNELNTVAVNNFASSFLDPNLRHTAFGVDDFDLDPNLSPLPREAYLWLRLIATDQMSFESPRFWSAWERTLRSLRVLLATPGDHGRRHPT